MAPAPPGADLGIRLTETPKEGSEMADRAIDVYLNDHLAGATLGSDLAAQIPGPA